MATYKGSLKRFESITKIILWIITCTLSFFLILLGDKILSDIDNWFVAPDFNTFINKTELSKIKTVEDELNKKINSLNDKKNNIQKALEVANRRYASEKQSFDNWIETRRTLGSPAEDVTVLSRAKELDRYRKVEEDWKSQLDILDKSMNDLNNEKNKLNLEKEKINREDRKKYDAEYNKYTVKIFFIRLAFVGPILLVGIFIFIKFRKRRFWPLVWGYVLFSIYAFFIGLVPYLPSFGGYIRYTVGILLTIFIGYYVIKQLALYTERKKLEMEQSSQDRAKKIMHDVAIKAYQSHCCPSCERDFFMRPKTLIPNNKDFENNESNYCSHCGLQLFDNCKKCGHRNFIHFPFCSFCGESIQNKGSELRKNL